MIYLISQAMAQSGASWFGWYYTAIRAPKSHSAARNILSIKGQQYNQCNVPTGHERLRPVFCFVEPGASWRMDYSLFCKLHFIAEMLTDRQGLSRVI